MARRGDIARRPLALAIKPRFDSFPTEALFSQCRNGQTSETSRLPLTRPHPDGLGSPKVISKMCDAGAKDVQLILLNSDRWPRVVYKRNTRRPKQPMPIKFKSL